MYVCIGYQQDNNLAYQYDYGLQPQAAGHVQYRFAPPSSNPPNYPPTDPGLVRFIKIMIILHAINLRWFLISLQ